MIHDFATLSKSNPQEAMRPQRRVAEVPVPQGSRQSQFRVVLIALTLLALVSFVVYSRFFIRESDTSEFSRNGMEVDEYLQESMLFGAVTEPSMLSNSDFMPFASSGVDTPDLGGTTLTPDEVRELSAFEAATGNGEVADSEFGFYDSLQASSWHVPVQKGVYLTEDDMKRASYTYMLQAASMRNHGDALALVAKLKAMGMNATYTQSSGSLGNTWYRVNVGPFSDVSVMNKAEDRLVAMRMMPLKRRIK